MKKSEIISSNYNKIIDVMVDRYEDVLISGGRVQYKLFVWEDGEIECLEGCQGDTSYLRPKQNESRELYYVCTIDAPCFDPWDMTDHSAPDDEEEREREKREIIDWLVDEYRHEGAEALLDATIEEAEMSEE